MSLCRRRFFNFHDIDDTLSPANGVGVQKPNESFTRCHRSVQLGKSRPVFPGPNLPKFRIGDVRSPNFHH